MDIEKEYSCLENNGMIYHRMIDCDEDYQETLQQYSDDILRVVKCDSNTYVMSVNIDGDTVQTQCKTEICLTYYNDKNELCYVDFDEEFTKKISVENMTNFAFSSVNAVAKYTNFRVVNQRKIDVHVSVSLDVKVYDKITCPCVSSCKDSRLKIEQIEIANINSTHNTRVEFDEEFNISSGSNPIKRLISNSSKVVVTECKLIKDKALVKMNVDICVLYSNDDDSVEKAIHSFTVSKIIDANGIDEDDIVIANAKIGNIYCKAKNTSSDELNTIEVYGNVCVSSTFIKKSKVDVISDGYIIGRNTRCSYSSYNCITKYKFINDIVSNNVSFKFNTDFNEIYDMDISVSNITCTGKCISVTLLAKALCRVDNSVCCLHSEGKIELDSFGLSEMLGAVCVESFDFSISSSCKIDARLNLLCNTFMYDIDKLNILCELDADDDIIDYPALSVYFGKKNESLWSIAKQFSSDTDLILKENNLNVDILDSNKVLIIPSV